jgi:hypothetical protein
MTGNFLHVDISKEGHKDEIVDSMEGSLKMVMNNLTRARMNLFKKSTGLFSYKMCDVEF